MWLMFREAMLTESLATGSALSPTTACGRHTFHGAAVEDHDGLDSALQRGGVIPLAMDSAFRGRTYHEGRPLAAWIGRCFRKIWVRLS